MIILTRRGENNKTFIHHKMNVNISHVHTPHMYKKGGRKIKDQSKCGFKKIIIFSIQKKL